MGKLYMDGAVATAEGFNIQAGQLLKIMNIWWIEVSNTSVQALLEWFQKLKADAGSTPTHDIDGIRPYEMCFMNTI